MGSGGVRVPGLELGEVIGQGGYGTVYAARQPQFDRTVAVKILGGRLDATAQARFERECRAVGALSSHPNIVSVYDGGVTDSGAPYLVMELLSGGSLAE
jgi:serine/threonine-protein kinase PknK